MPAPIAPWMSASEALTIWMLRTAMKAPSVEPMTATHIRNAPAVSTDRSADEGAMDGGTVGLSFGAIARAVMTAAPAACRSVRAAGTGLPRAIGLSGRQLPHSGRLVASSQLSGLGIDGRLNRHAGAQQPAELGLVERDFHWYAL